jgi:radical S-adenosyl methionine domain-containing protein 2
MLLESWLKKYSKYLDILAISCDSFNEETNKKIGRSSGEKSNHVENVFQIKDWCLKYGIKFKINTVINSLNYKEDMRKELIELNPSRWKVFQVLIIEGENNGKENGAIRNGQDFIISKNEFNDFLELHRDCPGFVSENNEQMATSYLLLDEEMRFLDCSKNKKTPSKSILEYSVEEAYNDSGFNETLFYERGGEYDWCKGESLVKDIEDL